MIWVLILQGLSLYKARELSQGFLGANRIHSRDVSRWPWGNSTFGSRPFGEHWAGSTGSQSFSEQESLPSSSCLNTFPPGKSLLGFSEASGLSCMKQPLLLTDFTFPQQQDNQHTLLLVPECSRPRLKHQVHFTFGASGQRDLFWNTDFTASQCFITVIIALSTRVPSFGSLWPPCPLVSWLNTYFHHTVDDQFKINHWLTVSYLPKPKKLQVATFPERAARVTPGTKPRSTVWPRWTPKGTSKHTPNCNRIMTSCKTVLKKLQPAFQ